MNTIASRKDAQNMHNKTYLESLVRDHYACAIRCFRRPVTCKELISFIRVQDECMDQPEAERLTAPDLDYMLDYARREITDSNFLS